MPRKRTINKALEPLGVRIGEYQAAAATIRAKYARMAEAELASMRHAVQHDVAVTYAHIGPSEMANSTGVSRSTIIRWRNEYAEQFGEDDISTLIAESHAKDTLSFGSESWEGINTAYIDRDGKRLFLLTGEDFGEGESVVEAEANKVPRPAWLTDAIMRQAVDATGVRLMLAPWNQK